MEFDAAISLYYDRARYYDPAAGRFLGQDPMGFAAGDADLYRYTANNPTNLVDPSGNDGPLDSITPQGTVTLNPIKNLPPGVDLIPPHSPIPEPLLPGTSPADGVILPGVGIIKVPQAGELTILGFDPKTCTYRIKVISRFPFHPVILYPAGGGSPFLLPPSVNGPGPGVGQDLSTFGPLYYDVSSGCGKKSPKANPALPPGYFPLSPR